MQDKKKSVNDPVMVKLKDEIVTKLNEINYSKPVFLGRSDYDRLGYIQRHFGVYLSGLKSQRKIADYRIGIGVHNRSMAQIRVLLHNKIGDAGKFFTYPVTIFGGV